ncbi:MAG: metabolite traffic protein EboE [Bacteroidetes bacterium]|nr:metabolite traffic protein EboE [Bacteroidota bacterium]MDA1267979.1 metabolite traffic protein EboE [Bacteroidota bacterium]
MNIKDLHLSYCSNIHAGDSWDATFQNLKIYIPEVKNRLRHRGAFGIGLRLSQEACLVLERPDRLLEFRDWLKKTNSYVFTLNCFPYGGFHRTKVKEQVHAPDWTTEARREYTIRCFRILSQLLPEGVEGGISTSPLSYRHWFVSDLEKKEAFDRSTSHLIAVVEELVRLQQETGKFLHLDIEPEPDGLLENSEELICYFKEWLLPKGKVSLAKQLGITKKEAETLIKSHLQVCYDVCHFAIGYEKPKEAFKKMKRARIGIGKIQLSAALKLLIPESPKERFSIGKRLAEFADTTYLHQVVGRTKEGGLICYPDLPQAIAKLGTTNDLEWRVHFHVPIFLENYGSFHSTQEDILEVLRLIKADASLTRHLEVETYTWEVLPEDTHLTLGEAISRELAWVRDRLD